jgi:hypothetical protein
MAEENARWGVPKIRGELLKLAARVKHFETAGMGI